MRNVEWSTCSHYSDIKTAYIFADKVDGVYYRRISRFTPDPVKVDTCLLNLNFDCWQVTR